MRIKSEESNPFNKPNISQKDHFHKELAKLKKKNLYLLIFIAFLLLVIIIILIISLYYKPYLPKEEKPVIIEEKKVDIPKIENTKEIKIQKNILEDIEYKPKYTYDYPIREMLLYEQRRPYLEMLNKKRTFEKRLPLTREITCQPHLAEYELGAFLSFLTKDTVYFETGSGCSSIIAKHYAKKSYAVEGCKKWYDKGVENGLKDNLIFRDLKPDNPDWSYPGRSSTLDDWKNYFQAYDKSYKADVILIDGRFKIATAMDIFDKIEEDTIVLIHEYPDRPNYFVLENYYQFIYIWDRLAAFVKKKDIQSIPLEVQQKYWNEFK